MGCIAHDEGTAHLVCVGKGNAQIPKAHIVELARERESCGFLQQAVKIVVFLRCIGRDRSVKEELPVCVNPAEELPVALQTPGASRDRLIVLESA